MKCVIETTRIGCHERRTNQTQRGGVVGQKSKKEWAYLIILVSGIFWSMLATPEGTGKGGASHQLSSNGVWSFSDPKEATKEAGEQQIIKRIESASKFIQTWKQVPPEKK